MCSFQISHSNLCCICCSLGVFESYKDWGRKLVSVSKGDANEGQSSCADASASPRSVATYSVVGEKNLHNSLAILEDDSTVNSVNTLLQSQVGNLSQGADIVAFVHSVFTRAHGGYPGQLPQGYMSCPCYCPAPLPYSLPSTVFLIQCSIVCSLAVQLVDIANDEAGNVNELDLTKLLESFGVVAVEYCE